MSIPDRICAGAEALWTPSFRDFAARSGGGCCRCLTPDRHWTIMPFSRGTGRMAIAGGCSRQSAWRETC